MTYEDPSSDLGTCGTAFAFGNGAAQCFIGSGHVQTSRWGWTNGPLSPGSYSFPLYAGAGKFDLTKVTLVGTLSVVRSTPFVVSSPSCRRSPSPPRFAGRRRPSRRPSAGWRPSPCSRANSSGTSSASGMSRVTSRASRCWARCSRCSGTLETSRRGSFTTRGASAASTTFRPSCARSAPASEVAADAAQSPHERGRRGDRWRGVPHPSRATVEPATR